MSEKKLTKKERLAEQRAQKQAKQQAAEKKAMMQKVIFAALLVGIVVGIVAIVRIAQPSVEDVVDVDPDPTAGVEDALVVVKEYADFQCPACAGVHPVVEEILEEYGDYITYVYNDFPLPQHTLAPTASIAGECVFRQDNDAFFEYASKTFSGQSSWNLLSARQAEDVFAGYAESTGIDMDQFNSCVSSKDAADTVNRDVQEARALNVNSTPTFFVNGERVVEAPYSISLREAIESALTEAGVDFEAQVEEIPAEVTQTVEFSDEDSVIQE